MTRPNINGIHHITAITASAAENLAFYETMLGLRLVKQTVNFDDPTTYHLYYGDAEGGPGTILTFFPWENLPQGTPGTGKVTAIAFTIPLDSLNFWRQRLTTASVRVEPFERFGEPGIRFSDPHGLPLELIGVPGPSSAMYWEAGDVLREHAIAGFHSATATVSSLEPIAALLKNVMGMTMTCQEQKRYRFTMNSQESPGRIYDVVFAPDATPGRSGYGSVHHIAFRTENDSTQAEWQTILRQAGLGVTEVRDRKYFRSIYFNSPGGVLFEIATDLPGFGVDEAFSDLGESLKLPDRFEPIRSSIEKQLPPLRTDVFHSVFREPAADSDDGRTIITMHGTGGSEHDLLGPAEKVSPASAIIGIRGRVLENGRPRFFSRLADNIFDEEDVFKRVRELADFLPSAASRHHRDPGKLTAMGYSNGANMAAAMLLLSPEIFSQAILIRPMLPVQDKEFPNLHGKRILILRGESDRVIPSKSTDLLVEKLREADADLTVRTVDAGHEFTVSDLEEISEWWQGREVFI